MWTFNFLMIVALIYPRIKILSFKSHIFEYYKFFILSTKQFVQCSPKLSLCRYNINILSCNY